VINNLAALLPMSIAANLMKWKLKSFSMGTVQEQSPVVQLQVDSVFFLEVIINLDLEQSSCRLPISHIGC
jgi:hypothetical protein